MLSALSLIPAAAFVLDTAGLIVAANDALLEMFGYEASELLGQPASLLLPLLLAPEPEPGNGASPAIRRVKLEGRRANGVPFPVELAMRELAGDDGDGTACVVRDLDTDALVAEAQRYFDVAFDSAPIGMALFNTDGEYVRVNSSLCVLLGRSADELLGRRDQELTHPDDRQSDLDAAWEILEGHRATHQCEKRFVRPDGSVVWTLANLTFLRDETGRPLSWLGQFQDITGRRAAEDAMRTSEERHRLVVRNLPGAGVVLLDRDLRVVLSEGGEMADALAETAAVAGQRLQDVATGEIGALVVPAAQAALDGEAAQLEAVSDRTGRTLAVEVGPHRNERGDVEGVLLIVRDVTQQRAAERARREAERRFEAAFEQAPIGMFMVDLEGRLERTNAALSQITGFSAAELEAMSAFDLVHPEDREDVRAAFAALVERGATLELEHRGAVGDDRELWLRMEATLMRSEDAAPVHALVQVQDVTARRRDEAELRYLADHDPLTGLMNRRAFTQALEGHLAWTRRYGAEGAVLVVDLDGLKQINDRSGHDAGDDVLIGSATALRDRLRETDAIARIGGDEFAVLLPAGGRYEAETVAKALLPAVCEPAGVTASIGVAVIDAPELDADGLLTRADRAMYEAKRLGGDRHSVA